MTEHAKDLVMAAPPVSVGALTLWGLPLSEWVLILTALYTIFLLITKLPLVLRVIWDGWLWIKRRFNGRN